MKKELRVQQYEKVYRQYGTVFNTMNNAMTWF